MSLLKVTVSADGVRREFVGEGEEQVGDDFFASQSLADLTAAQHVDPSVDIGTMNGAWPDDEDVETFLGSIGER